MIVFLIPFSVAAAVFVTGVAKYAAAPLLRRPTGTHRKPPWWRRLTAKET